MEDELNGARAAAHTGYGSVVYGEIPISDPRHQNMIGFAMEVASGGFVEAHIENMTPQQEAAANNEADLNSSYVTQRTIDDLNDFANALLAQNYYYAGEVQGFVDRNGNYNPIDLQGISPLSSDSSTRAEQVIEHQLNFRAEQELLTPYLERNLQNQANNVPPPISSNSSNNPNDPNTQS